MADTIAELSRDVGRLEGTMTQVCKAMEQHRSDDIIAHAAMLASVTALSLKVDSSISGLGGKVDGLRDDRNKLVGSWSAFAALALVASAIATTVHWVAAAAIPGS